MFETHLMSNRRVRLGRLKPFKGNVQQSLRWFLSHWHWLLSFGLHGVTFAALSMSGWGHLSQDLVSYGDLSIEILGVEGGEDGDGFIHEPQVGPQNSSEAYVQQHEKISSAEEFQELYEELVDDESVEKSVALSEKDQSIDRSESDPLTAHSFEEKPASSSLESSVDQGEVVGSRGTQGGGSAYRTYKELLYSYLERNKHYPMMARRMRIEGTVGVRFVVLRDGSIVDIEVNAPCEAEVLNQAAITSVERAHQKLPLPEEYEFDELPVQISFNYQMR